MAVGMSLTAGLLHVSQLIVVPESHPAMREFCDAFCQPMGPLRRPSINLPLTRLSWLRGRDPSNVSSMVHGAEMRSLKPAPVNRALRKAYRHRALFGEELGWAPGLAHLDRSMSVQDFRKRK